MADFTNGVSESDVRDIYNTSAAPEAVEAAIGAAKQFVADNTNRPGYDDEDYNRIIAYTTIHFLASDPQLTGFNVGDAQHDFERTGGGVGIRETYYGRLANQLSGGDLAGGSSQNVFFKSI